MGSQCSGVYFEEYNFKCLHQTYHAENHNNFKGPAESRADMRLLDGLKKQWSFFSRIQEVSSADVKASYLITDEIASASKPYSHSKLLVFIMLCFCWSGPPEVKLGCMWPLD